MVSEDSHLHGVCAPESSLREEVGQLQTYTPRLEEHYELVARLAGHRCDLSDRASEKNRDLCENIREVWA